MKVLVKYGGISLIAGGLFFILTNVVFTPLVNMEAPFEEVAKSTMFSYRMISAAITVIFFLCGAIGLHLYQIESTNKFGHITFFLTLIGCAFVLSNEWHQIFILPELARNSPEALASLSASENLNGYGLGAMIAALTFSLGWILFSISMILSKAYSRLGPILIIAGFFIIPTLSVILTPTWGGVIGSTIMGFAFCYLGRELLISKK